MKKLLLFLFILNSWNFTSAQTQFFLDDSLAALIKITTNSELKVDYLNRLGFLTLDGGNRKGAFELFKQADSISIKINYKTGLAYGEFYHGLLTWIEGDISNAERQLINSISSLEAKAVKFDLYSPLSAIRFFFNDTKQYEKKLKFYQDKLHYYESKDMIENLGSCYHGIGNYFTISGNVEKAIEYYSKAGENWKSWGNETCNYSMQMIVALNYKNWGNLAHAKILIGKLENVRSPLLAFVIHIIYKRQQAEIEILEHNFNEALVIYFELDKIRERLGEVNTIINFIDIAKVYLHIDKPDSAKIFLDLADSGIRENKHTVWNANGDMEYNFYLSNYYKLKGRNDLALNKMREALAEVKKEKYSKLILKYLDALSGLAYELGKSAEAYHYLEEHNRLNDLLEKKSQETRIAFYETEKKEQQITLLNKDKIIQDQEIEKQKLLRNGFVGGFAVVLLFAGVFFAQRNKISKGKKRSDELLLNILPEEVAEELKVKGSADAKQFDAVTVMFTDFKNFTQISERLSPAELVAEIHSCFKAFDDIIGRHNIEKIKTIGDSYMCAGGLPIANNSHAEDVVKAALEIIEFMKRRIGERVNGSDLRFELRIGIHTGPVVAGIVGVKKFAYDIWGDTVNIASRMESSGEAGKVNISGSTYELVKDKFACVHRGKIQAKNKGEIDMYFVGRSLVEG